MTPSPIGALWRVLQAGYRWVRRHRGIFSTVALSPVGRSFIG